MKKNDNIKYIIRYYIVGVVVEAIFKGLFVYDLQGLIVHGLPLLAVYFKMKRTETNPDFINQKKPIKKRLSYLFSVFGFIVLAGEITYQVLLFIVTLLKFNGYLELMERLLVLFSGQKIEYSLLKIVVLIMSTSILGPILEEILFRGFIYDYLKDKTPRVSVYLNTILFGVVHGALLPQFYVTGYVYTKMREKEGDIYGVILLHIFNNFLVDLQYFLPKATEVILWSSMAYFFLFIIRRKLSLKFVR